jgi:hypothetical protein
MLAFQVRGWELVAGNVPPAAIRSLQPHTRRIVRISDGRYSIELPLEHPPERVLPVLTAAGATLVSLNPIRDSLEDFFVQQVRGHRAFDEREQVGVVKASGVAR